MRPDRVEQSKRMAISIASCVSALMFIAAAATWVVSLSREPVFRWLNTRWSTELAASEGRILFLWHWGRWPTLPPDFPDDQTKFERVVIRPPSPFEHDFKFTTAPLRFAGFMSGQTQSEDITVVPCWFVLLVSAVLPTRWYLLRRGPWLRLRRRRRNECIYCGYSLAASPGRCPECGRLPGSPIYVD